MIDPSVPLQAAVVAALNADGPLKALVGDGIYDSIPAGAAFPYASLGDGHFIDHSNGCASAGDLYQDVHLWSRAVGRVEAKRMAARTAFVLDVALVIAGYDVVTHRIENILHFKDKDGLTSRSMVTVCYSVHAQA